MVKGNDAGVRVTMTKVGTTLDEWLRSADSVEERDLATFEEMPEDPYIWSPFRIQVNKNENTKKEKKNHSRPSTLDLLSF